MLKIIFCLLFSALLLSACNNNIENSVSVADKDGKTHPEAEVTPPSKLELTDTQPSQTSLSWLASKDAKEYEILRDNKLVKTLPSNLLSFTDTGLTPNKGYTYTLTAINKEGKRSKSLTLSITTRDNHTPVIEPRTEPILIRSDLAINSVIHTFSATDADDDSITFAIETDNLGLFSITNKGQLTLNKSANSAARQVSALTVSASDGFSKTFSEIIIGTLPTASNIDQKGIFRAVYSDSSINVDINTLKVLEIFPDRPTDISKETHFKSPTDYGANYGQKMEAYLLPPASGDYQFWIASDDESELYLFKLGEAEGEPIASVSSWVNEDNYDLRPSQKSTKLNLEKDSIYIIRALMTESRGGDHLSVAWSGPGFDRQLIRDDHLRLPLDFIAPDPVIDLKWIDTNESSGILSWRAAVDNRGIDKYIVTLDGKLLSSTADLELPITDLEGNKHYRFEVIAQDESGNQSGIIETKIVRIDDYTAPEVPTALNVFDSTPTSVQLEWTGSQEQPPVLYRVFLDNIFALATYETQAKLTNLTPNTTYQLKIEALDFVGNTSVSDSIKATTESILEGKPFINGSIYQFGLTTLADKGTFVGQISVTATDAQAVNLTIQPSSHAEYFSLTNDGKLTLTKVLPSHIKRVSLQIEASNQTHSTEIPVQIYQFDGSKKGVFQEIWSSTSPTTLKEFDFIQPESSINKLTHFQSPYNLGSRYTQRVRGFLTVPVTGNYRFWVASDDQSIVKLSNDLSPENTRMIASISGWTGLEEYHDYSTDIDNVFLEKGRYYYIEAIHQDIGGDSHLSVAFKGEHMDEKMLLTGKYLVPYNEVMPSRAFIRSATQSGFANDNSTASIEFKLLQNVDNATVTIFYGEMDAGPTDIGWQFNKNVNVFTEGDHTIEIDGLTAGKTYHFRVAIETPQGTIWSSSAIELPTVITDPTKTAGEALPQRLDISVLYNDIEHQITLEKHSVRSPDFQFLTFDSRRQQQYQPVIPMPEPRTYRGIVENDPFLTVTGVIDAKGTLHLTLWRGDRNIAFIRHSVEEHIDSTKLGNNETSTFDRSMDVSIPEITNNQFYVPEPEGNFHNYLSRVRFLHEASQFANRANSNLLDALAQMEGHINETDYVWAQKTGLRWDMGQAIVEQHGDSTADGMQSRPAPKDSTNFSIDFQDPAGGGYCWGGGDWIGCVADFTIHWGYTHEIGHNMGMGHNEQTDNDYQIMAPGPHMSNMQSRQTLRRLQTGTKFQPVTPIEHPMLPAAFKDYLTVYQDEPGTIDVLGNDYDVNGDSLSISDYDSTTKEGGTVSLINGVFHYTPPQGFIGGDQFTYIVTDGRLKTTGPVQIQVVSNSQTAHWIPEQLTDNQITDQLMLSKSLNAIGLEKISEDLALGDTLTSHAKGIAVTIPLVADRNFSKDALGHQLHSHALDPGQKSFTVTGWVKVTGDGNSYLLLGKSSSRANYLRYGGFEICTEGESGLDLTFQVNFRSRLMHTNAYSFTQTDALTSGSWHHIALVIDRENQRMSGYVDGVEAGQTTLPASNSPIMAAMNNSGYGGGSPFIAGLHAKPLCQTDNEDNETCELAQNQAIGEIALYHRALSEQEIITNAAIK